MFVFYSTPEGAEHDLSLLQKLCKIDKVFCDLYS